MQRRDFLRFALLTPLAASIPLAYGETAKPSGTEPIPDGKPHRFELSHQHFLLDGTPFQIRSGEMHPARIPAEYWLHRIRMAKAMGLNTIAIYVMWNYLESEPGVFDFTTERRDFVRFIRLCQQEGMWVYLRPGPYVCAEWDLGGLPAYLLRDPSIRVRTKDDPRYMQAVQRYMDAIAPKIAPLMANRGGPILMMQIENEYASFGHDLDYLLRLRTMWQAHGIEGPFSISDGLGQIQKQKTYVPGAALGLDGDTDFEAAQAIAGEAPVWMGEGYPGWLTHWGDPDFQIGNFTATLRKLLAEGRSFNMYVVHGGTNFGFTAGANARDDYANFEPVITSYDYGAPINERGEATPDYRRFRALLAAHVSHPLPEPPPPPPTMAFTQVIARPFASIWDNLPVPAHTVKKPDPNEILFAQDHGMVLYRKTLLRGGMLNMEGLRDYGTVFSDGKYLDYVSRVNKPGLHVQHYVDIPQPANGAGTTVDILVDSFGHVGYGQAMYDFKGIVGAVTLDGEELHGWQAHSLPIDEAYVAGLPPMNENSTIRPGMFFKAIVMLDKLGDCYIDMSDWDKGYVWVNGKLLGRYWRIGPQQRLYCPASWFSRGRNELLVFDMHRVTPTAIRSSDRLKW
ncbi:beta-galactosidase [Dyella psychrodurans]|uniref:Beta-galactosidase n=1 Tax=Dyella psychrodurans TaxID=1927960 RepID=A0A370XEC2_9GAMM|nr:beta-galactosidase [Dyella psychrodurans]RDS86637.1 beta-galactosidase [Dyella psychrodurans]